MARREAFLKVRLRALATWEHLARQNLSQNELASRLGITSGYLSQLINGQRCPSARIRRRLLEIIPGVAFDDLFVVEHRDTEPSAQTSCDESTPIRVEEDRQWP